MRDFGKFETLATAVLRLGDPLYARVGHAGVNAEGSTVKARVDNIGFVRDADPPHMIAVQHTVTQRGKLKAKWLQVPAEDAGRERSRRSTTQEGDLPKTAKVAEEQRRAMPGLKVTLALTCSVEPPEDLTLSVVAAGRRLGIDVDLWPASRLAAVLDDDAEGQWLRRKHLGLPQDRLSVELLRELGATSVERRRPLDERRDRVRRVLDDLLAAAIDARPLTFLAAEPGSGKSVACHSLLLSHLDRGGLALVLDEDVVETAPSLEAAVEITLRRADPTLALECGSAALALASPSSPLLLVVEDVNRSRRPATVVERLTAWIPEGAGDLDAGATMPSWRLVCPTWRRWLDLLPDPTRKKVKRCVLPGGAFLPTEGAAAVERRASALGSVVSPLDSQRLSESLGHDPLLIGLHAFEAGSDPTRVIGLWLDASTTRLAASGGRYLGPDYRNVLRRLGLAMLVNAEPSPTWDTVASWFSAAEDEPLAMLRDVASHDEVMGVTSDGRVVFRHDRIREELMVEAAAVLMEARGLTNELWAEPFFAGVLGRALATDRVPDEAVGRAQAYNPLSLFHAFAALSDREGSKRALVAAAIRDWLSDEGARESAGMHRRAAALEVLAGVEASEVPSFVALFRSHSDAVTQAKLRNGDLLAAYELCLVSQPGMTDPWRDRLLAHARLRFGSRLLSMVDASLRNPDAQAWEMIGALRLGGFLADSTLAGAVAACWRRDEERERHIGDHLWAAMRCFGDGSDDTLAAACDVWASLPDDRTAENRVSERDEVAAFELGWAVGQAGLPALALHFLSRRAASDDALASQIALLLTRVDRPEAARIVAVTKGRLATAKGVRVPARIVGRRGDGADFGAATRDALRALWADRAESTNVRHEAFNVWEGGREGDDVAALRCVHPDDTIADAAIAARIRRGDEGAVPELLARLRASQSAFWWQLGREFWSDALTVAFDERLATIDPTSNGHDDEQFDLVAAELLARMPPREAERILSKHWPRLRGRRSYVGVAAYLARPRLTDLVREVTATERLREGTFFAFGVALRNHPGANTRERVENLTMYLPVMSDLDLNLFRTLSVERGWQDLARRFEAYLPEVKRHSSGTDESAFRSRLDELVGTLGDMFILADLERLSAGAPDAARRLLGVAMDWADDRGTVEAFDLAASIVAHAGNRSDAERLWSTATHLRSDDETIGLVVQAIASDISFAVRLRTLS